MSIPTSSFNGKNATLQNLEEFGLVGLQKAEPAAGWRRVQFGANEVRAFSAAHPDGALLSYGDVLTAAESGLSKIHPTYAGRSLKGAFDGHGLIGADLV